MLPVRDTYDRLAPRVKTLAGVLKDDGEMGAVGASVRLGGVDHEVRLERGERSFHLTLRAGRATLYRGPLAAWYGAAEKTGGMTGHTRGRAA